MTLHSIFIATKAPSHEDTPRFIPIAPPRLQQPAPFRGGERCFEFATRFQIFVTIELLSNGIAFFVANDWQLTLRFNQWVTGRSDNIDRIFIKPYFKGLPEAPPRLQQPAPFRGGERCFEFATRFQIFVTIELIYNGIVNPLSD